MAGDGARRGLRGGINLGGTPLVDDPDWLVGVEGARHLRHATAYLASSRPNG